MLKLSPESVAQLRAEQRAGRAAVAKAKAELEARAKLERERRRLAARLPRARARAAKAERAALATAVNRAIDRAARRSALLAEITHLPATAFVSDRHAAAYLGTEVGVLRCWSGMRRGPRYHGANEFIRYRITDLDQWMSTRANEIVEKPEGLFDVAPAPQLVWSSEQSAPAAQEAAGQPSELIEEN
jgi:hypothetical protein